jgi:magnesium chelatase family protein
MVHSMAGLIAKGALTRTRPFRSPHHSASMAALTGGGVRAKPGEVSLAHNGVLFLDELPEFSPQALDSLRQPLETGEVMVARANYHVRYPAKVQLVAAQNPCRCGVGGPGRGHCGKAPRCQMSYQSRVSGPLLDRIDLTVDVPPVTAADLALPAPAEGTAEVAARVATAREVQSQRAAKAGDGAQPLNARAEGEWLDTIAALDAPARALEPHPAPRPHHRRPGRRGLGAPRPHRRGADLPPHRPRRRELRREPGQQLQSLTPPPFALRPNPARLRAAAGA